MITNKDQAKLIAEYISCDRKCKFNSKIYNSNKKWNNKTCLCECKNQPKYKKYYNCNLSTCICGNSSHLKSKVDTSVTKYDEIIIFTDNVSTKKTNIGTTKKTNTIATNATSTALINVHSKKVRDCYILYTALLVIILLL